MSFGEAASAITIDRSTTDFFKLFYRNSPKVALEWFVYLVTLEFELHHHSDFRPSIVTLKNLKF
jgi:hypothetical protein